MEQGERLQTRFRKIIKLLFDTGFTSHPAVSSLHKAGRFVKSVSDYKTTQPIHEDEISKPSKQGVIRETKDYLMIALGMILYGIGWTLFLLPNDITTGGVPGIASIVYFATGFPVQYTYFAINAVLLMVSLKVLGFRFSLKTIFGVFTLTFFLSVIQKLTRARR